MKNAAITEAVNRAAQSGIRVEGPFAADSLFHAPGCDACIAMYHDQGLIPVKTLDFRRTVNITLGLPFVRTSVGHGTGLDIAGKGEADPTSLIEAYRVAESMAANESAGRPGPVAVTAARPADDIFRAVIEAADPYDGVPRCGDEILARYKKGRYKRLFVFGFGKAVPPMLRAIADRMGSLVTGGVAITKHGCPAEAGGPASTFTRRDIPCRTRRA